MITVPLVVEVRRGALGDLEKILADQRISSSGRVAIAVDATYGPIVRETLGLAGADWFTVVGGTINAAIKLVEQIRPRTPPGPPPDPQQRLDASRDRGSGGSGLGYDAVVGIGGATTLDVIKFAAARLGLPMIAVATDLAHDGMASPISTLDNDAGPGSHGVPAPIRSYGVPAPIRTAAQAVMNHPGSILEDTFLTTLAEALVLSGLSMVVAGTSRPTSGACHEISHAIDLLRPARRAYHGEQVGLGAAFA